jgi:hypothetical protein
MLDSTGRERICRRRFIGRTAADASRSCSIAVGGGGGVVLR